MTIPCTRSHCLFVASSNTLSKEAPSLTQLVPELDGHDVVQIDLAGETLLSAIRNQIDTAPDSPADAVHLTKDILIPRWAGATKSALVLRSPSQMRCPDPVGCIISIANLIHTHSDLPANAGRLVIIDEASYFNAHVDILLPLFTLHENCLFIPEEAA